MAIEDPRAMSIGRHLWELLHPAVDPERLEALGWQRAYGHGLMGRLLRDGWAPPPVAEGASETTPIGGTQA